MKQRTETEKERQDKLEYLKEYLQGLGTVAVAFSSGVDSTFLLKTAHEVLGDQVIAVTARSVFFPEREQEDAKAFCEKEGIRQIFFDADVLQIDGVKMNPKNRCYLCKKQLFGKIKEIAVQNHVENVVEGSNLDDLGDYRPGLKAVSELNFKSPLRECGLTKADIRDLSKKMELPTWDKPSFACLASRFMYGETITKEKLSMVEQAEEIMRTLGFLQFRVRIHGMLARIEVLPEEFDKMRKNEIRETIATELKKLGFAYVTLDLNGYRTGSMNEILNLQDVENVDEMK